MESSTKTVDFSLFPHCVEVLDSFDDDSCEEITLQWGARLGKTFSIALMIASTLANRPFPCVFGDADETSVIRVFRRLWQTLDGVADLKEALPAPNARKNNLIVTSVGTVYGAWAGSANTAADLDARLVILNEADKMVPLSTRTEADFRLLLKKRNKLFPHPKTVQASTPSVEGLSYIDACRRAGDNRRREVPCPHCGHFQTLRTGDGVKPGGMRFERLLSKKLDAKKARDTAWYECEKCLGRIEEGHRFKMCNAGLWVPEGCAVANGKIVGQPTRPGPHHSFGPLHSLHSLVGTTLGGQAYRFVEALLSQFKSEAIRDWKNSEEGEVWSAAPSTQLMSSLEGRIGEERPLGIVPAWVKFVTVGCDVSALGDGDHQFHWWASGWGLGGRGCLIDCGTIFGSEKLLEWASTVTFHCPERGGMFKPSIVLVDSGYFTNAMYELCDRSDGLLTPVKGGNRDADKPFSNDIAGNEMVKGAFRGEKEAWRKRLKEALQQFDLIEINTHLTQQWCEDRLNGVIKFTHASWYSVPKVIFTVEKKAQVDLPRHMVGDYLHGGSWLKRYREQDYRDAWRYSRVGAEIHTKNGAEWDALIDTIILADQARTPVPTSDENQGTTGLFGGSFLITDRNYGEEDTGDYEE